MSEIDVAGSPVQHGQLNSNVTLKGSGLQSISCTTSVNIGGGAVSNLSASASQITFTTPSAVSGVVTVTLTDSGNNSNVDNHLIFITDPGATGLGTASPTAGSTDSLVGSSFDFHLGSGQEAYAAAYASDSGGGCPGSPAAKPTLMDPQHVRVPMPSQYCQGTVTVTLTAPCSTNNSVCSGASNNATSMGFPFAEHFATAATVSGLSGSGVAESTETINGSGFGSNGQSVTVNGVGAAIASWNDTRVSFVVPDAATTGTVRLTRFDGTQFGAGNLTVTATVTGLSTNSAAVGDPVTVNGSGFGTQTGTVTVNSTTATVSSWSPTSITFTVPDGASTGPVVVTTSGTNSPSSTPTLTINPRITGITPTHAQAGSLIEVDGTTFGTSQGTVQIGGEAGSVTLWGDKQVLVNLPGDLSPGATTVTVSPPSEAAASAPFTVDAPPPPSSSSSSSSSNNSSGSSSSSNHSGGASPTPGLIAPNPAGPVIAHGPVTFFRPPPAPGPVSLRLDSAAGQADPGGTVKFTVTLKAFGKPVVGAPVDLLLVIEPGSDASIDPPHAVTDANGQVSGTIHLSRTAGDHIVLARSGIYSDEIRVVGRSATNAAATANGGGGGASPPASTPPFLAVRSPVMWALISCLILFGLGFGLNLMTSPAVAGAGAAAGPAASAGSAAPRGVLASVLAPIATLSEAVAGIAGLIAAAGAHTLGGFRRGRG